MVNERKKEMILQSGIIKSHAVNAYPLLGQCPCKDEFIFFIGHHIIPLFISTTWMGLTYELFEMG